MNDETANLLIECSDEITRINSAAGRTVFNPAITSALRAAIVSAGVDAAEQLVSTDPPRYTLHERIGEYLRYDRNPTAPDARYTRVEAIELWRDRDRVCTFESRTSAAVTDQERADAKHVLGLLVQERYNERRETLADTHAGLTERHPDEHRAIVFCECETALAYRALKKERP